MDDFQRFLKDPTSVAPLTPRAFVSHYLTQCTDIPHFLSSLPALLKTSHNLSDSLRSILAPGAESAEGYVARVSAELLLSRFDTPMARLLAQERKKTKKPVSSFERWSRVQEQSTASVFRSQAPLTCDLDDLKARVNDKYVKDEIERKNLQKFLVFKKNRNEFYLRQQRFEEEQLRQHVKDLKKELVLEKHKTTTENTEIMQNKNSVRQASMVEAERRKLEMLAERSHEAATERLRREHRAEIRKNDYARAVLQWQAQVLGTRQSRC